MNTEIQTDDKTWYDNFYRDERMSRGLVIAREIVDRYETVQHARLFSIEKWHQLLGDVAGKRILYVACGLEARGVLLALRGAEVWVLDLSVEAVRHQRRVAYANGAENSTHPVVGSCDRLPFPDQSFDIVVGMGIWHHLQEDLETPSSELERVLRQEGFAVFEEPIARSNALKRMRGWFSVAPPRGASPQCRPLTPEAFTFFIRRFNAECYFFKVFARLGRILLGERPLEFASGWERVAAYLLLSFDYLLLRVPGMNRLAGAIVFKLRPAGGTSN